MAPDRTKAAFCSQWHHEITAYVYDINRNNFVFETIESEDCDCEPRDINIEYFPEREEFFYYCVSKNYSIHSGRYLKNGTFEILPESKLINITSCGVPNRINVGYFSNSENYFVYADSDSQEDRLRKDCISFTPNSLIPSGNRCALDVINNTAIDSLFIRQPSLNCKVALSSEMDMLLASERLSIAMLLSVEGRLRCRL